MFTGLIEEIGTVKNVRRERNCLKANYSASIVLNETKVGDSISVNGVCQTVTELSHDSFWADISEETLKKTTAKSLNTGDRVNLERAMCLGDRIGGHLVQGHVSGIASIYAITKESEMYKMTVMLPGEMMKYVIPEGSIAVEGISLTTAEVNKIDNTVLLQIIPLTFEKTVLQYRKSGDFLNIETDLFGRYAESLLSTKNGESLTIEKMKNWGF